MDKNIIFIKTPKCASTSIKSELIRYSTYKNLKVLDYAIGFKNEFSIKNSWIDNLNAHGIYAPKHDNMNYNINVDHVTGTDENINRLKEIMDPTKDFIIISIIRDPLSRLISNYTGTPSTGWTKTSEGFNDWYLKNNDKNVMEVFKGVHKMFPDFWMNNFLSNYIGVDNPKDVKSKYDLVLIVEEFDKSLEKLSELLGFKFNESFENKGFRGTKIEPSQEVIDLFKENNNKDYELYNTCKELYYTFK